MNKIKFILLIIFIALLFFLAGIFAEKKISGKPLSATLSTDCTGAVKVDTGNSYSDGYEKGLVESKNAVDCEKYAKNLLQNQNDILMTVKSVNDKQIQVEFPDSYIGLNTQSMATRTVTFSGDIMIEKRVNKDTEEYIKEEDEFKKKIETKDYVIDENESFSAPLSYTVEYKNISDLKVGDVIMIFTDDDIRKENTVEAVKIVLTDFSSEQESAPLSYEDSESEISDIALAPKSGNEDANTVISANVTGPPKSTTEDLTNNESSITDKTVLPKGEL